MMEMLEWQGWVALLGELSPSAIYAKTIYSYEIDKRNHSHPHHRMTNTMWHMQALDTSLIFLQVKLSFNIQRYAHTQTNTPTHLRTVTARHTSSAESPKFIHLNCNWTTWEPTKHHKHLSEQGKCNKTKDNTRKIVVDCSVPTHPHPHTNNHTHKDEWRRMRVDGWMDGDGWQKWWRKTNNEEKNEVIAERSKGCQ